MTQNIQKVKPVTQTLEKDCRDVTEKRIMELLTQSTVTELSPFEKKLGGCGKGSKMDLIINIRKTISDDEAQFNKGSRKIWGYSGGWLSAVCPHGIVYGLKFVLRAESFRDYVDILLSMKHQPPVYIIDMAHMIVAQRNRRRQNMFHPHNGKVAEAAEENMDKAAAGILSLSFPFLIEQKSKAAQSAEEDVHLVTGSKFRLSI